MKTTITPAERLQLIGLLALAERYDKAIHEVRDAAYQLLGVDATDVDRSLNVPGHIDDAIWDGGRRDADGLLKRLDVTIVDAPQRQESEA